MQRGISIANLWSRKAKTARQRWQFNGTSAPLPKGPVGKIRRMELRNPDWAGYGGKPVGA